MGDDDTLSASMMMQHAKTALADNQYRQLCGTVQEAQKTAMLRTAWRIEGTLREYPQFTPVNVWFDYPVHHQDESGALSDLDPEGESTPRQLAIKKQGAVKEKNESIFQMAYNSISFDHPPTVTELAETTGLSEKTVRRNAVTHGYVVKNSIVQIAGSEGKDEK